MEIEIGTEYLVKSARKGTFSMLVNHVDGEWITGIITKGKAGAMLKYNERGKGEEITIRRGLSSLEKVA